MANRLMEAIFRFATSQVSSCELGRQRTQCDSRTAFLHDGWEAEWGPEVRSRSGDSIQGSRVPVQHVHT